MIIIQMHLLLLCTVACKCARQFITCPLICVIGHHGCSQNSGSRAHAAYKPPIENSLRCLRKYFQMIEADYNA